MADNGFTFFNHCFHGKACTCTQVKQPTTFALKKPGQTFDVGIH